MQKTRTLDDFCHLAKFKKTGLDTATACCPCHDDQRESLSLRVNGDTLLLHCFAGCEFQDILKASDERSGLPSPASNQSHASRVIEEYPYHDEQGKLLYTVQRLVPKAFRAKRPDGLGNWTYKMGDVRRVLYKLPELLASPADQPVYFCEGEKDVNALRALGLTATTSPFGAKSYREEYAQLLAGRKVIILPDNDKPGLEFAEKVARSLIGVSASTQIVELPGLEDKQDVSDWLAAGWTVSDLSELTENAPTEQTCRLSTWHFGDKEPEPTKWLVEGLIPEESCVVIGAEEKTGKSWLLFHLALCLASGLPFLGRFNVNRRGKVLIYSPESGREAKRRRLYGLCWGMGIEPSEVEESLPLISDNLNFADPVNVVQVRQLIEEVKPVLFVVDPMACAHGGIDENQAGEVQPLLNNLRDLISHSSGMSVALAHHLNKGHRDRTAGHGLRGSSALPAWYDVLVSLRRTDDQANGPRRVAVSMRDELPPSPFGFVLRVQPGKLPDLCSFALEAVEEEEDKPEPSANEGAMSDVLALIRERSGELNSSELIECFKGKISRATVYRYIDKLLTRTNIIMNEEGRFESCE